jgi:hypothetical protein
MASPNEIMINLPLSFTYYVASSMNNTASCDAEGSVVMTYARIRITYEHMMTHMGPHNHSGSTCCILDNVTCLLTWLCHFNSWRQIRCTTRTCNNHWPLRSNYLYVRSRWQNESEKGLVHISKFIKQRNHTNIIVVSAPKRHFLLTRSCVNSEVITFNRKLHKRMKTHEYVKIIDSDMHREKFTRQGLHMNTVGKK